MALKKLRFITSLATYGNFQGCGLPQIVLSGRSNVGKSSLINSLCGEKRLARTSTTPGKTALINIYLVEGRFHLVDLPGYGYARVSKGEKERWARMIDGYFREASTLAAALHLVDIRHEPSADDRDMNAFLRTAAFPFVTVAMKADKISRAQRSRNLQRIGRALAVQPWELIAYSSVTGEGRDAVARAIEGFLPPVKTRVAESD